jgi:metal iron transporter
MGAPSESTLPHDTPHVIPVDEDSKGISVLLKDTTMVGAEKSIVNIEETEIEDSPAPKNINLLRRIRENKSIRKSGEVFVKFCKFTGPGTIISVAYVDPDNFQTAISSGVEFKFKLLFMILLSNLIAIYLQVCGTPLLLP